MGVTNSKKGPILESHATWCRNLVMLVKGSYSQEPGILPLFAYGWCTLWEGNRRASTYTFLLDGGVFRDGWWSSRGLGLQQREQSSQWLRTRAPAMEPARWPNRPDGTIHTNPLHELCSEGRHHGWTLWPLLQLELQIRLSHNQRMIRAFWYLKLTKFLELYWERKNRKLQVKN